MSAVAAPPEPVTPPPPSGTRTTDDGDDNVYDALRGIAHELFVLQNATSNPDCVPSLDVVNTVVWRLSRRALDAAATFDVDLAKRKPVAEVSASVPSRVTPSGEPIRLAAARRVRRLQEEIGGIAAAHGDVYEHLDASIVRMIGIARELQCDVDELREYTGADS